MVIFTSPSISGSVTTPKIFSASGSTDLEISSAASFTSLRVRSLPPVMLKRTPVAPSMETSIRGLLRAERAASVARDSPVPMPMAIRAVPALLIMAFTSAKSRFISPGIVMTSEMAWIPWRSTSSAILKASFTEICWSQRSRRRSLGMTSRVSTLSFSHCKPCLATADRLVPSKAKGLVTTATVRAPVSLISSAMTGAAPVPVPPPMPAAMNTISEPLICSRSSSRLSSAEALPSSGLPPTPSPLVRLSPMRMRRGASVFIRA